MSDEKTQRQGGQTTRMVDPYMAARRSPEQLCNSIYEHAPHDWRCDCGHQVWCTGKTGLVAGVSGTTPEDPDE